MSLFGFVWEASSWYRGMDFALWSCQRFIVNPGQGCASAV